MPGRAGNPRGNKVLLVSALMAPETYRRVFRDAPERPSQAAQKYHLVLAEGLAEAGVAVTALSMPPVSRSTSKHAFLNLRGETVGGVAYRYLPIVNLPVLRHGMTWLFAFLYTLFHAGRDTRVLVNGLYMTLSGGARAGAKLRGCPCGAIVTDLPDVLSGNSRIGRMNARDLTKYDGYVLLTEAMNDRVNPRGKPHLVVEGQADSRMGERHNILAQKHAGKVCLYAGMLHEKYGILRLTEAFSMVEDPEARLHIYGTGDAAERVREAAKRDPRILYKGVADNDTVVTDEIHSTLLINPRPSDEEFTRYSFPSKNLEYMASGTPVLTTLLPGMPEEYLPYVFTFREETPAGMAETLREILALPEETLHEKGLAAKAFVLGEKSNARQAARIAAFLEGL